ncbi:uncharacterized protein VTP21DRAFT_3395 [Calcarisporiella thermophila]|uniref:uncharacterized protein n=1 Tax=Calcarisporiella thermophila TaxID=911321 RepID=UPI00374332DC
MFTNIHSVFFILCLLVSFVCASVLPSRSAITRRDGAKKPSAKGDYDYEPAILDDDVRSILSKLTLKQKIGQMTQIQLGKIITKETRELNLTAVKEFAEEYYVGTYIDSPDNFDDDNRPGFNVSTWIKLQAEIQKINLEREPHLPILYGLDSVHGAGYIMGAVMFTHQLGRAATFEPSYTRKIAEVTAKDMAAVGIRWNFVPVLEVAIEKYWSRVHETFGEDPLVVSKFGVAHVVGSQRNGNLKDPRGAVAATMKHYLGYSLPFSGQDTEPAFISDYFLYTNIIPPFKAASDAGVSTTMESQNSINGDPVVSSAKYLKNILRHQIGFKGLLVSDWAEINQLVDVHKTARTQKDAAQQAIMQGTVDVSMVPSDIKFAENVYQLVQEGAIPESRIDISAGKMLQLKKDLGLFKNAIPSEKNPMLKTIGQQADKDLAHATAQESMTLLKNANSTLPINLSKIKNIFLVGAGSNSLRLQTSGWSIDWQGPPAATGDEYYKYAGGGITYLQAVQKRCEKHKKCKVSHMEGFDFYGNYTDNDLRKAIEQGRKADITLLFVAEDSYSEYMGNIHDLTLPSGQIEFAKSYISSMPKDKKVVLVSVTARTRIMGDLPDLANAWIWTYLPGPWGGTALADLLFIDNSNTPPITNPSGRLPITYPRFVGDSRSVYWRSSSEGYAPLYPFGWGLSYSIFNYTDIKLSDTSLSKDIGDKEKIRVTVTIKNLGPYDGKHAVFCFVHQDVRSVVPEADRLAGFQKLMFKKGETKEVIFDIGREHLAFYGLNTDFNGPNLPKKIMESGNITVTAGNLIYGTMTGEWVSNQDGIFPILLPPPPQTNLTQPPPPPPPEIEGLHFFASRQAHFEIV